MFPLLLMIFTFSYASACASFGIRFKELEEIRRIQADNITQPVNISCDPRTMTFGFVFGTSEYEVESFICPAALHNGVLTKKGGNVTVVKTKKPPSGLSYGSVKNRVVSHTVRSDGPFYKFVTKKTIPEGYTKDSWLTDVYLMHGFYSKDQNLWVTCLYEKELSPQILNWKLSHFRSNQYIHLKIEKEKTKRVTQIFNNSNIRRIFNCFGSQPIADVTGIALNTETASIRKTTYSGALNQKLEINVLEPACSDAYQVKKVGLALEEGFLQNAQSSIVFESLREHHEGVYTVSDHPECSDSKDRDSYFYIMPKDCLDGYYGEGCSQQCSCVNNGVCHPLIGACVCQPGFNGTSCENECPPRHFGSKCQFSCSSSHLGEGVPKDKRDCKGVLFCLPKPYGCSCAAGYTGMFCDNDFKPFHRSCPEISRISTIPNKVTILFIVGFFLLLILIILLVFVIIWQRIRLQIKDKTSKMEVHEKTREKENVNQDNLYENDSSTAYIETLSEDAEYEKPPIYDIPTSGIRLVRGPLKLNS